MGNKRGQVYDEIVDVKLEDIQPYWNNPRMNERTKEALIDAFRKIGFNQPILIDERNIIVKGHARYHAAKLAGYRTIPCLISSATEKQNKEDRILDNKIQDLSTWDKRTLEEELQGVDFEIAHVVELDEVVNEVETEVHNPDDEDPVVYLVCPECGKEYQIPKSEVLLMETVESGPE